jgi:hypothetical protein
MDGGAPLDAGELDEYRVDFTRWPRFRQARDAVAGVGDAS